MKPSNRFTRKLSHMAVAMALTAGAGFAPMVSAVEEGVCGPMDVVFVIDDTGSMGGAIANIKAGIAGLAADVVTASGDDYQMGLVTFKDAPQTDVDLAPGNEAAVQAGVAALAASGGAGGPEASDSSLDTIINADNAGSDGGPCGDAFDTAGFRAEADKVLIMVTDNLPGGCNDNYIVGVDDVNAQRVADDAAAADIKISAISVGGGFGDMLTIMPAYAATTGGVYGTTDFAGTGLSDIIAGVIASCGSSANECPLSQGYWKNHEEAWPVDSLIVGDDDVYTKEDLLEILNTPPKGGNSYLILAHQTIAALLNIENGSDPTVIDEELDAALAALADVDLTGNAKTKDPELNAVAGVLDEYNNRILTPDCEDSSEEEEVIE